LRFLDVLFAVIPVFGRPANRKDIFYSLFAIHRPWGGYNAAILLSEFS
jgi:hypothetical protein